MNHLSPFPPRQQRTVKPRGEPLAALGLLIASWIGVRAALWEEPRFELAAKPQQRQDARPVADPAPADKRPVALPRLASPATPTALPTFSAPPRPDPATDQRQSETMRDAQAHYHLLQLANQLPLTEPEVNIAAPHAAILPVPALLAAPTPNGMAPPAAPDLPRWSGDAWLLLRPGSNGFNAPGAGLPGAVIPAGFYGGSQAGAVLRYRLAPTSGWRPTLYLRAASGIEKPRGEEAALGFAFRPLPKLPVAAMVEGRATRTVSGTTVRPAAALVTELPPARLPAGLRAEAYAQAGYIGGRGSTAFVDGQARIERPLASMGRFRLRAGGGVWGGAQRGANRLDLGPTATIEIPLGAQPRVLRPTTAFASPAGRLRGRGRW